MVEGEQAMNKYMGPRQQGDSQDTKEAMAMINAARKRGKSISYAIAMQVVKRRRELAAMALRAQEKAQ